MKITIQLFILLFALNTLGQSKIENETSIILEEGKMLYKSEMASWYGTDIFMEKYNDKERIGGYVSYSENEISKCIFFSKDETPKVLGTIGFDATFKVETAKTDLVERELTEYEFDLYKIRTEALRIINSDTLYKLFKNSSFNLIPIVTNKEKKVFVITGPTNNGVMLFGNDYLLTFDRNNKLVKQKQLHRSLIPIEFGSKDEIEATIHSHVIDDLITSTDICTLMLYGKFSKIKTHYVMSKKYVSIWDCKKETLAVVTREAFEKMKE
jgi:hypothetical protein